MDKTEVELITSSSNFVNIQNQLNDLTSILTDKNSELFEATRLKENFIINNNKLKGDISLKNQEIEKILIELNEKENQKENLRDQINDLSIIFLLFFFFACFS